MDKSTPNNIGTDEKKEVTHTTNLLNNNKKDIGGEGHPVQDIPHEAPPAGKSPEGPMNGELMTFTKMLESLDAVQAGIAEESEDVMNDQLEGSSFDGGVDSNIGINPMNDDELLETLNQIFTPILIMQGIEGDISEQVQEACSQDGVLFERNIIKFDDSARMAQLTSVCSLLIARQKNSPKYQMYKKAAEIQRSMKTEIQKDEYAAAQALAQKYLVKVSTTNNSSVARQAAQELLPETQH